MILLLGAALLLCTAGAYISCTDHRHAWYGPWCQAVLAAACGWLWILLARRYQSPADVVRASLAWDAVYFAAYYLVPVLACWADPKPQVIAGAAIVAAGLAVAHL